MLLFIFFLHVFRLDKLLDLVISTFEMHMNDNNAHLFGM
jgi:hypothetical protein